MNLYHVVMLLNNTLRRVICDGQCRGNMVYAKLRIKYELNTLLNQKCLSLVMQVLNTELSSYNRIDDVFVSRGSDNLKLESR